MSLGLKKRRREIRSLHDLLDMWEQENNHLLHPLLYNAVEISLDRWKRLGLEQKKKAKHVIQQVNTAVEFTFEPQFPSLGSSAFAQRQLGHKDLWGGGDRGYSLGEDYNSANIEKIFKRYTMLEFPKQTKQFKDPQSGVRGSLGSVVFRQVVRKNCIYGRRPLTLIHQGATVHHSHPRVLMLVNLSQRDKKTVWTQANMCGFTGRCANRGACASCSK